MSTKEPLKYYGIDVEEWAASYAATINEFPASRFVVIPDGDLVRFVFGNNGPPINEEGTRGSPVYSVAVSMSPVLAARLRDILNKIIEVRPINETGDAGK